MTFSQHWSLSRSPSICCSKVQCEASPFTSKPFKPESRKEEILEELREDAGLWQAAPAWSCERRPGVCFPIPGSAGSGRARFSSMREASRRQRSFQSQALWPASLAGGGLRAWLACRSIKAWDQRRPPGAGVSRAKRPSAEESCVMPSTGCPGGLRRQSVFVTLQSLSHLGGVSTEYRSECRILQGKNLSLTTVFGGGWRRHAHLVRSSSGSSKQVSRDVCSWWNCGGIRFLISCLCRTRSGGSR